MKKKNILITGNPGVGKTTVIKKLSERFRPVGVSGFFTQEIRESGRRLGFEIETFDGQRAVLAHESIRTRHRVGKYGVDIAVFERLMGSALSLSRPDAGLYIIDEIGKMELFSGLFTRQMLAVMNSSKVLLASIARKGPPIIREIKSRGDVRIFEIKVSNRNGIVSDIESEIASILV